jgi:hypothetical protein
MSQAVRRKLPFRSRTRVRLEGRNLQLWRRSEFRLQGWLVTRLQGQLPLGILPWISLVVAMIGGDRWSYVMNAAQGVTARSKTDGINLIEASTAEIEQRGIEICVWRGNSKGSSFSSIDPPSSVGYLGATTVADTL